MTGTSHEKVKSDHLKRNAYLYIRQSTLRQVLENAESTFRQYDLRQAAVALGWPIERIMVIDSDQGQSGATAADREGFQRLVTEVSIQRLAAKPFGYVSQRGALRIRQPQTGGQLTSQNPILGDQVFPPA